MAITSLRRWATAAQASLASTVIMRRSDMGSPPVSDHGHRICFISGLLAYAGTASQAAFVHLRHL
jgi:hypothetical protein